MGLSRYRRVIMTAVAAVLPSVSTMASGALQPLPQRVWLSVRDPQSPAGTRSRRTKGKSAMVLIILVIAILIGTPQQAFANVNVAGNLHSYYDACIAKFRPVGLGNQVDRLDSSPHETKVIKSAGTITKADDETAARNGQGTNVTIRWNPTDVSPIEGEGVDHDPCANLYHEMTHAYENTKGIKYRDDCITNDGHNWGIAITEVHAIRDENVYRGKQGLSQRTSYGGQPLPSIDQDCKTP